MNEIRSAMNDTGVSQEEWDRIFGKSEVCRWKHYESYNPESKTVVLWTKTECGKVHGRDDNGVLECHYCGKKVVIE